MRARACILATLATALALLSPVTQAETLPECPEAGTSIPTGVGEHGVQVNDDCTVDTWLFRHVICVGPWGGTAEASAGPATIEASYCSPPGGPTPSWITVETASTAERPDWCQVRDHSPDVVADRFDEDTGGCFIRVAPFGGCIGGSGHERTLHVGPVRLVVLVCSPPPGSVPALM